MWSGSITILNGCQLRVISVPRRNQYDPVSGRESCMAPKVLVPVADGTEEIEAVCIIDVLRRAGAEVTVASVNGLQITASRGVKIVADKLIGECVSETYDLIALPGGIPGAEHLRDSTVLSEMLFRQQAAGKFYAAICASPAVVFQAIGLLASRRATCYPSYKAQIPNQSGMESRVVVDDHCITSQGPGTALEFSITLVSLLFDENKAKEVAGAMVLSV